MTGELLPREGYFYWGHVLRGNYSSIHFRNFFKDERFKLLHVIDKQENVVYNWQTGESEAYNPVEKSYIKDLEGQYDIIVYFEKQEFDIRETRELLKFSSKIFNLFSFPEFYGAVYKRYPLDSISTNWILDTSTNLWFKISIYLRLRRAFDIFSAILIFVLTLPLWIIAIIGVQTHFQGSNIFHSGKNRTVRTKV